MEIIKVKEGSRTFLAIAPKFENNIPRRTDEVFYNSHQEINRDISVLVLRAYAKKNCKKDLTVCEPLCGSGIRSCRYILETPTSSIYCNDLNPYAFELTKKNIENISKRLQNNIQVFNLSGNFFLQMLNNEHLNFDFIDIDPFGTPIPFAQSSIQLATIQGLLAFTATDLASLAGLYPRALYAKYCISQFNQRIGNIHEIASRSLVTGIQHVGLTLNQSLIPITTVYHRHFIRTFLLRYRGVNRVLDLTGFINLCKNCQTRFRSTLENKRTICPFCDSFDVLKIGPLFLGALQNIEYLLIMLEDDHLQKLGTKKRLLKMIPRLVDEVSIDIPWSFDIHKLAKKVKVRVPSSTRVIEELQKKGFKSIKTHYSGNTIKTTAQENEINKVIKSI